MKFILTKELGRLTKWLRILGFDAEYWRQDNLASLVVEASKDSRVILTRNHRLSPRHGVKILMVNEERVKGQLAEVLKALKVKPASDMMFRRCTICNTELAAVDKGQVEGRVPEYVFKTQEDFVSCPQCRRIYWQGTHWGNVQNILEEIGSL